jgi:hypothetical protein
MQSTDYVILLCSLALSAPFGSTDFNDMWYFISLLTCIQRNAFNTMTNLDFQFIQKLNVRIFRYNLRN